MSDPNDITAEDKRMLDALFSAAQASPMEMPEPLTARILADAAALQVPVPATPVRHFGLMRWCAEIRDGLGGWGALAGLSTAMVAGVWIGASDLAWLSTLPGIGAAEISVDGDLELFFPSYADFLGES